MKTHVKMQVTTKHGSACYMAYIVSHTREDYDYEARDRSEKVFEKALRKASGFRGKGLTTIGNNYGRDIGNRTISVYGTYDVGVV